MSDQKIVEHGHHRTVENGTEGKDQTVQWRCLDCGMSAGSLFYSTQAVPGCPERPESLDYLTVGAKRPKYAGGDPLSDQEIRDKVRKQWKDKADRIILMTEPVLHLDIRDWQPVDDREGVVATFTHHGVPYELTYSRASLESETVRMAARVVKHSKILHAAKAAGITVRFHRTGQEKEMIGQTPNYVIGYDVTLIRTVDGTEMATSLHYLAGMSEAEEIDHGPAGACSTYVGPALLKFQVLWQLLHQAKNNIEKPVSEWPEQAQQLRVFLGEKLLDVWVTHVVGD